MVHLIQRMLRLIDRYLNGITMYRLLVYGLGSLAGVAIALAAAGLISAKPLPLLASLGILIPVSYVTNRIMAAIWHASTNAESWLITALILFFLLPPPTTINWCAGLVVAGILGAATKFILAVNRKHIFNPAAIAAVVASWTGLTFDSWWVATEHMLPFTLLLGFLVTRKLHRFTLVSTFGIAALIVMLVNGVGQGQGVYDIAKASLESWPTVFLGTIMLTEPATLPPSLWRQLVYGVIVGVVYASQVTLGPLSITPALALLMGNLYSYLASPKYKVRMQLQRITQLSPRIYDLAFLPERSVTFRPGQYAEWTLPHTHADSRGNRRTLSIASSPARNEMHIGIKLPERPSSFKRALMQMKPGDYLMAGQFAGTFVLPRDVSRKLAFIAGGIGITPFISMLTYLADVREQRNIVVFYLISSPEDAGYINVLRHFSQSGITVVPILNAPQMPAGWSGRIGSLDPAILAQEAPDYRERTFYLSGPNGMVEHYQDVLYDLGVPARRVITDYFSGY